MYCDSKMNVIYQFLNNFNYNFHSFLNGYLLNLLTESKIQERNKNYKQRKYKCPTTREIFETHSNVSRLTHVVWYMITI